MATLKTNYKDDLFSGSRKYEMIRNQDGTVSFEDVTDYLQEGDPFGSTDINVTNAEVNTLNQNLTEKIEQKSGSITADSESYTGINIDWITYDKTKKKIVLHEKGTGADAGIPFSGKNPDINPSKSDTFQFIVGASSSWSLYGYLPVSGYKTLSLKNMSSGISLESAFVDASGTVLSSITINGTWTDYTIPDDAVYLRTRGLYSSMNYNPVAYALTN